MPSTKNHLRLKRTAFAALLASTALVSTALVSGGAFADSKVSLSGHVAAWVKDAKKLGPANEHETVRLAAYLPFRNAAELDRLITAQSAPGSADYGRYLTPEAFRARFAPAPATVAAAERNLRALGFTIGHEPASRAFIEFTGSVAQVKTAFRVSQNLYAFQGKTMRANAEEPTLPAALASAVTHIGGLEQTGLLLHPFHVSPRGKFGASAAAGSGVTPNAPPPTAAGIPSPYCSTYFGDTVATLSTPPTPYPAQLPWLVCGYDPQQMRAAYGVDKVSLDGAGIRVAIVDAFASPTILYDANRYAHNHGLPKLDASNFTQVIPKGIFQVPATDRCGPQGWYTEESLDVAAVHSMAPGASIVYIGGSSCDISLNNALYEAIDNGRADIFTNSYGYNGDPLSTGERAVLDAQFQQAAAQGMTVLFSSGDNGDASAQTLIAQASAPASSPYVTAVGGTSLGLTDAAGDKSEWGWGTYRAYLSGALVNSASSVTDTGVGPYAFYAGAGGGPALFERQPSYQKKAVPIALATGTYDVFGTFYPLSPARRVVPDVSMEADPYTGMIYGETYTTSVNSYSNIGCQPRSATTEYCEFSIGGTSLATPLFAGTVAVLDQLRIANGLPLLGFANPALYKLPIGAPGSTNTPLVDVLAPATPTAVLRGYVNDLTRVRVVTINSVPSPSCPGGICEGVDDLTLLTTPGYDNVTGLGVPYLPSLLLALGSK